MGTTYAELKEQAAEFGAKNPSSFRDIFNNYEQVWFSADEAGRSEVQTIVAKEMD